MGDPFVIFFFVMAVIVIATSITIWLSKDEKPEEDAKPDWGLRGQYIDAYKWLASNYYIIDNAFNEWDSTNDEKKVRFFNYYMCYQVSQHPEYYLPKNFPLMFNEVSCEDGGLSAYIVADDFMREFIDKVAYLKDDKPIKELCKKYKIPTDFGIKKSIEYNSEDINDYLFTSRRHLKYARRGFLGHETKTDRFSTKMKIKPYIIDDGVHVTDHGAVGFGSVKCMEALDSMYSDMLKVKEGATPIRELLKELASQKSKNTGIDVDFI